MQALNTTFSRFRDTTYYVTKIGYTTIHEERKNGVRVGTTEIYVTNHSVGDIYIKMVYSNGFPRELYTWGNFKLKSFHGAPSIIRWFDEGEAYEMEYHQLHSVSDSIHVVGYNETFGHIYYMHKPEQYVSPLHYYSIEWQPKEFTIEYSHDGLLHRDDGPAFIQINKSTREVLVEYYQYYAVIKSFIIDIRITV